MIFHILTLFPELYPGPLGVSIFKKAQEKEIFRLKIYSLRSYVSERVDDAPFGGGSGMVLGCEAVDRCLSSLHEEVRQQGTFLVMSPRGPILDGNRAAFYGQSLKKHCVLLCPRFEGVDQRVLDWWGFMPVSVGSVILAGGDVAAYIFLESVLRFVPGVLGNASSLEEESSVDSFSYHHYTRPSNWRGVGVCRVLRSGHHVRISQWRQRNKEMVTCCYGYF